MTSDTHFYHENVIKYCKRPFTNATEMNAEIIRRWNRVVNGDDIVYHLGDFGFCSKDATKDLVKRLNGRIRLILGNHDTKPVTWYYDAGFDRAYDKPIIIQKFLILSHEPPEFVDESTPYAWFYGHVHNSEPYLTVTPHTACVCQERWGYTPVDLDVLLQQMEEAKNTYVRGE